MNLEEASKHPDRLAKEAADAAYSSLHHIHEIVDRQYGNKLNDDQKLHVVSAIEEACRAYKAAKAAESSIVNSGFFPEDDDVAETPKIVETKPEDPPEPDKPYMEEDVDLVRAYVLTHGSVYKTQSVEQVAMKFVAPVDLSTIHPGGVEETYSVVGLETSNDKDDDDPRVYALVLYAVAPGFRYFHRSFTEFSVHEREKIVDMMQKGNAGRFDNEKIGAIP